MMSSGVWFATAYGLGLATGADIALSDMAIDAGLMGATAYASDLAHTALNMNPSVATSAAMSGAIYAGVQKVYRGSDAYLVNFAGGAVNDYLVEVWASSMA